MPVRLSTGTVDSIATSLASDFTYGYLHLFDGTQPTSCDDDEGAYTLLAIISEDSSGNIGLILNFETDGSIIKDAGQTWSGVALADGTVGWGRFYQDPIEQGASTSATRMDFNAATSGAPLTMANTTVTTGAIVTIDTCTMTMPKE